MKLVNIQTIILIGVLQFIGLLSYAQTIQERLGYSKNTKLLIVHADDLGVSHSENAASFEGMDNGYITSASILVPTPWLSEVATYAGQNPKADLGIHVCMTSEWVDYKWSPVSGTSVVPSLVNERGHFFDNSESFDAKADAAQVGVEIRAQIDKAMVFGITPTHLDSHMGAMYGRPDILREYIKISKKYGIPIATTAGRLKSILPDLDVSDMILVDQIFSAGPGDYDSGMATFYANTMKSLKPGLNSMIIHAAYDDAEMQAICVSKKYWGSDWRQQDFDFFTSKKCKQIIENENIQLITWREINDKLMK